MPSVPSIPTPVSHVSFDKPTSDNGKDLIVYTRRKDTTSDLPLVVSSNPRNPTTPLPSIPFENNVSARNDDDLPIALCKKKRSCTNHPISNFVSYKAVKPSYRTFVSFVSSVQVPSNLKDAISRSFWRDAI